MVPASKYVMQGQLLGAINKESLFVFVDKLIPTSLLALVCCVCVSIQSATPCIISTYGAPYSKKSSDPPPRDGVRPLAFFRVAIVQGSS